MIRGAQIRAARALIGWTQWELAGASGVSEISIKNIESGLTDPRGGTLAILVRALENLDVEFTNSGLPGVRIRSPRVHSLKQFASFVRNSKTFVRNGPALHTDAEIERLRKEKDRLCDEIEKLAELSRQAVVSYDDFDKHRAALQELGITMPNGLVSAVADALHDERLEIWGQHERAEARKAVEMPEPPPTTITEKTQKQLAPEKSSAASSKRATGAARAKELAIGAVKEKLAKVDAPDDVKLERKRKLVAPPATEKIRNSNPQ